MGQSASIQRDREEFRTRNHRRLSQIVHERERQSSSSRTRANGHQNNDQPTPVSSTSVPQDSHPSHPIATFSRQISAQSIPVLRGGSGNTRELSTRDEIFYEQHEERPLVNMEDLGMRDAPITHITASPMPRRSSRISRLSTMILPRYALNEVSAGDQQQQQQNSSEGRSLRRRLSDTNPSRRTLPSEAHRSSRLSILGSISRRNRTAPWSRRPRERAPISRPFLLNPDASSPPSGFPTSSLQDVLPRRNLSPGAVNPLSRFFSIGNDSRLARVRRSISAPFETLLPRSHSVSVQDQAAQTPPQRPSRARPLSTYDSDFRVSQHEATDSNLDPDRSESDRSPLQNREHGTSGVPTVLESPERAPSRPDGPSWTERWAERGSMGRREGRRMPSMLRGRSSRLIRRENEGPLPRILHLAATAIAAQLSGMAEPDMQAVGPDDLDGSLQNLFRTLQNASNLNGEARTQDDDQNTTRSAGTLPPLNFLRVFRFVGPGPNVNGTRNERARRRSRAENAPAIEEDAAEDQEGRTVTLVVVGVRSVPSDRAAQEDVGTEPSLDTLLNLQSSIPSTNLLRNGAGGLLRHANGRSRFPHRRRASIGGLNTFPANYDSQRHQRTLSGSSRQGSGDATPNNGAATPVVVSESPPGPHPPPSTPAEPALSTYSSAATTPSRRPSSASAIQQPPIPNRDVATQSLREAGILTSEDQPNRVQHRRRSDSEFARHRDLGAGAARRNGVVEPDEIDTSDTPASGSRSWLIYVVGTNLSEDHPALTTPSLFTDVRSFASDLQFSHVKTNLHI